MVKNTIGKDKLVVSTRPDIAVMVSLRAHVSVLLVALRVYRPGGTSSMYMPCASVFATLVGGFVKTLAPVKVVIESFVFRW